MSMRLIAVFGVVVAAVAATFFVVTKHNQPYAGQDSRAIASLSTEDVEALLAGEGWGLAKPAELHGYPGPLHILELADELGLSAGQKADIEKIYDSMKSAAQEAGKRYVDAEAHVSDVFKLGNANPAILDSVLDESANAIAALRAVHLKAHLDSTPILTADQRENYKTLRGYDGSSGSHSGHSH